MKIITLTLNVALDVHCYIEHFQPFLENIADVLSRDAGGKGINVSRALCAMDVPNTAVAVIGSEGRADFERMLVSDGIYPLTVEIEGRIRENLTVHTRSQGETRISFAGPRADAALLGRVRDAILPLIDGDTVLTFTGSAPDGLEPCELVKFLSSLKDRGARLVIDSRSLAKEQVIALAPYLIKPNEEEIAAYSDVVVSDLESAARAAQSLREQGIENVMISLGSRGAVLCTAEGSFAASAPSIDVKSTIGAGDSSVAGFLAAASEGRSAPELLRTAVSYGSAACLVDGTKAPKREDILSIYDRVQVKRI